MPAGKSLFSPQLLLKQREVKGGSRVPCQPCQPRQPLPLPGSWCVPPPRPGPSPAHSVFSSMCPLCAWQDRGPKRPEQLMPSQADRPGQLNLAQDFP